jgi:hypothetical protein
LEDRDNNLEALEVLQYLKIYSELKPMSERLLKVTNKVAYEEFVRYRNMIDHNKHNPIANYKDLSKPDLNEKINSLENELRGKVGNKKDGYIENELNTLKTTCPTKVDVFVDKIMSDGQSKGVYETTFEGEIKSVGDFKCKADGQGTIMVKAKDPKIVGQLTETGERRKVVAVDGLVPLQTEDELNRWAEIQVEREEKEKKRKEKEDENAAASVSLLLNDLENDPDFQLEDGSADWEKIYNKYDNLKINSTI